MEHKPAMNDQRQQVREVVDTIELLRLKRRDQWRDGAHPDCKRFTQEELCDLAYGAYKNMALGRTLRIPLRTDLLRIADYLESTIHETNDLLLAAQYMPEQIELRDDQYQAALERGRLLVQTLPLPARLVTRGRVVEAVNAPILSTHGLASLAQIRPEQRDAIHWYLNPFSPTFPRYAFNEDMWHRTVSSMVSMFRLVHQPFQQESWYRNLLRQYQALPGFSTFWDRGTTHVNLLVMRSART